MVCVSLQACPILNAAQHLVFLSCFSMPSRINISHMFCLVLVSSECCQRLVVEQNNVHLKTSDGKGHEISDVSGTLFKEHLRNTKFFVQLYR